MRFGNWLYLWLDAHQRTMSGERTVVLEAPGMDPWLTAFPALRALTVSRDLVRYHDRREWDAERSWKQHFGVDFTRESLNAFISDFLAPYMGRGDSGMLVINVRRGDYYSNPGLRERYGFDQLGYLRDAIAMVGPVERVLIVSDDPEWCRENLMDLVEQICQNVDFADRDPVANFKAVAGAERIIGTNSTFTYWAAYVSGARHASPVIVMPRFHARLPQGTEAYQLDPRWIALDGYS
jgi:Glycosyl transferase family 11